MKRLFSLLIAVGLLTGCGTLIPKKVEFFQKKVKAVPETSAKEIELQREAADYIIVKTELAKDQALSAGVTNVAQTVQDAHTVATGLSVSLGPPESPWKAEAERLNLKLKEERADFNSRLEDYRKSTDKVVGKKIEGTGLVRIPYFLYIGILLGLACLAWFALKIYGATNPIVGLGTTVVGRTSGAVVSRGFHELVEGGQLFRTELAKSGLTDEIKAKVTDLFVSAHERRQSRDVQEIIKPLVNPAA